MEKKPKKTSGAHRKNKFTIEEIGDVYAKCSNNKTKTAEALGVTRHTLLNWLREVPGLKEHLIVREKELLDTVEDILLDTIKSGDVKAMKLFLEAKGKRRGYGKTIVQQNVTNVPLTPITSEMTEEEALDTYRATIDDNN